MGFKCKILFYCIILFTKLRLKFQKPLPKLPVPELESSLKKYLRCLMPIVTEREYEKVEKLVEDLLKPSGEGYFLQKLLHEFSNEKDNWVIFIFIF